MEDHYLTTSGIQQTPPISLNSSSSSSLISNSSSSDNAFKKPQKYNLQVLIDIWKDGRRNELDKQASEIADSKESSLLSRKKLAEQTKNFRKLVDEEKLKNFGALFKLYQEEIDKLTQRSKFAETSFLSVYKLLAEAPDPLFALTSSLDESQRNSKIAELELENKKYKTELDEFRKEFQEIRNQEVTIRRLEDKISEYENKIEEMVEYRVQSREKTLKEEHQTALEFFKEGEYEARRQLAQLEKDFSRVQRSLELTQTELLDLKSKYDERQSAKGSEVDMLADELERARSRILVLEREREKFSEQNESSVKSHHLSMNINSGDLELEIAQKDIEINQLKEHIQKLEKQVLSDNNSSKLELSDLAQQLSAETAKVKSLTEQIKSSPTPQEFESLKTQLNILKKALDFASEDNVNDKTVERLLKEKSKKLETENILLKTNIANVETRLTQVTQQLTKSEETVAELKGLVSKLEDDISRECNSATLSKSIEDMMLEPIHRSSSSTSLNSPNSNSNSTSSSRVEESSMLRIVCKQRDRFKLTILQLESENKELVQQLQSKENEIESLRGDNLKLYEKIKYLHSYRTNVVVDQESTKNGDELDAKYGSLYEDSVNPFVVFNRKERYRRYTELNPAEKVILNSGRFLLSTKFSRTFLFIYSVVLHILVFITLYKYSASSRC